MLTEIMAGDPRLVDGALEIAVLGTLELQKLIFPQKSRVLVHLRCHQVEHKIEEQEECQERQN